MGLNILSMYIIYFFYSLLIIVNVSTSIPYVFGQTNQTTQPRQELEADKLDAEIDKLRQEFKVLEGQLNPISYPGLILTYVGSFLVAFICSLSFLHIMVGRGRGIRFLQ